MRYFTICAIAVVAVLLVAGCAKPSLVGKWTATTQAAGTTVTDVTEFRADGTMTQTKSLNGRELGSGTGTWKLDDDKTLHISIQNQTADGKVEFGKDQFTITLSLGGTTIVQTYTKAK